MQRALLLFDGSHSTTVSARCCQGIPCSDRLVGGCEAFSSLIPCTAAAASVGPKTYTWQSLSVKPQRLLSELRCSSSDSSEVRPLPCL